MSKHQVHHNSTTKNTSGDKSKVNIPVLSVVAVIAIVLIVLMTVSLQSKISESGNINVNTQDISGQALKVIKVQESLCKIIVGRTTIYDDNTLAVTLSAEETTYYAGYAVNLEYINDEGCTVNVNGNSAYLAIGQIQRLGSLYVTVKDVVN